ncbi:right-handed parallel beta-helix repeat-containing protein [Cellulomonas sp.]|uniref:right-handed parallel beta-helix repeat-containing protein n=1 Tax=Cellulomonas sp. TaxID=40001 RepID=UPI001B1B4AA0|nr:right-handed parallel beta-helix repeat-containing protein [Cellulomonas sp.]MBO9554684.1 hypothetical protein [Cellulomonas sp.]
MRVPATLSCLALASAAVLVATPAAADPGTPACGSTLTVDTVLRSDLVCAGDGLTLAADVDLDLHGHTLRGTAGGVGLSIASVGSATVKNGTVTGWDTAVRTLVDWDVDEGSGPLTVDRVSFRGNGTGIDGTGDGGLRAKSMTVTRSTFTGNRRAGMTAELTTVRIDCTTFADNAVGYWGDTGSSATVTSTRWLRNDRALIAVEANADIARSTFRDNPQAVYSTGAVAGIRLTDSRLSGSDVAFDGRGAEARISSSTFVGNTTAVVVGPFGATVSSSTFRDNGTTVTLDPDALWSEPSVVVQGNVFRHNADGLRLEGVGAFVSIGGNTARYNTGWGIYAPGATDLGGDTASHNGNEPQCVGVACS